MKECDILTGYLSLSTALYISLEARIIIAESLEILFSRNYSKMSEKTEFAWSVLNDPRLFMLLTDALRLYATLPQHLDNVDETQHSILVILISVNAFNLSRYILYRRSAS